MRRNFGEEKSIPGIVGKGEEGKYMKTDVKVRDKVKEKRGHTLSPNTTSIL